MGKDLEISIEDLRAGEFKKVAMVIGIEAALKLSKEFKGTSIYVPSVDRAIKVAARDRRIVAEFNGANGRKLAKKYQLSLVWIQEIIKRARRKGAK
jgi:Mor family transcriptional regulator